MIEFLAFGDLRALGKKWDVKELNKYLDSTPLNSVQRYIATLMHRFSLDRNCPAMFFKAPQIGRGAIDGIEILRDMETTEIYEVHNWMLGFSLSHFGEEYGVQLIENGIYLLYKRGFLEGEWQKYERFITGKDGISISAE